MWTSSVQLGVRWVAWEGFYTPYGVETPRADVSTCVVFRLVAFLWLDGLGGGGLGHLVDEEVEAVLEVDACDGGVDVEEEEAGLGANFAESVFYAACYDVVGDASEGLQAYDFVYAGAAEFHDLAGYEPSLAELVDEVEDGGGVGGHVEYRAFGAVEAETAFYFVPLLVAALDVAFEELGDESGLERGLLDVVLVVDFVVDEGLEEEAEERWYYDLDALVLEPVGYVELSEAVVFDVDLAYEAYGAWGYAVGFYGVVFVDCGIEEVE